MAIPTCLVSISPLLADVVEHREEIRASSFLVQEKKRSARWSARQSVCEFSWGGSFNSTKVKLLSFDHAPRIASRLSPRGQFQGLVDELEVASLLEGRPGAFRDQHRVRGRQDR